MIPRLSCIFILFVELPATLYPQKPDRQWPALSRLKVGQGVVVIKSNMKQHDGTFVSVSDESLVIQEHHSNLALKRADVARVSTGSAGKRGEHALELGQRWEP